MRSLGLREDDALKDALSYDEMLCATLWHGRPITDADVAAVQKYLQGRANGHSIRFAITCRR